MGKDGGGGSMRDVLPWMFEMVRAKACSVAESVLPTDAGLPSNVRTVAFLGFCFVAAVSAMACEACMSDPEK